MANNAANLLGRRTKQRIGDQWAKRPPRAQSGLENALKKGQQCDQVAGLSRKTSDWGSADEAQKTRSLARTEAHFWLDLVRAFRGAPEGPSSWQFGVKNALKIALTTR